MGDKDTLTDEEIEYLKKHFNDLPIWKIYGVKYIKGKSPRIEDEIRI